MDVVEYEELAHREEWEGIRSALSSFTQVMSNNPERS